MVQSISFSIDGRSVTAQTDETILEVAQREGLRIPNLCYKHGYREAGNCRSCMVEIEGERVLSASCCRKPLQGMNVRVDSTRATQARNMVLELLKAEVSGAPDSDDELAYWCQAEAIGQPRFERRVNPAPDSSHPAILVDLARCIHCTRCVRACREEQVNDVIGLACRGALTRIVFDQSRPLGDSSCVACGECVQACPTGALSEAFKPGPDVNGAERKVDSICPYCGVGCLLTWHVRDNRIVRAEGRDGPANRSRLCVKGRFGFDYVHHEGRLLKPLIRRSDAPKTPVPVAPADMMELFREASWQEALDAAAARFSDIRGEHGANALAGFGSAKGSNEEAYLFQKLIRTGFGTNNVDHCTRLCHASSVSALLEGIGSGSVSNPVADVEKAELIMVIGAKPTVNHPVAATLMKNAVQKGARMIVLDPYRSDLSRHADWHLQFRPDTDVALLNAMMYCIIDEGPIDRDFIDQRTTGFEALSQIVQAYPPQKVEALCGIPAAQIREVARLYATSKASMIFWGMGVSQNVHGTDNARCLIAMALMTGHIGRPGTGLHPLRGQNNVQGASDAGLIPMMYPNYQPVDDAGARQWFENYWGCELTGQRGLTVVEIMQAASRGEMRGLYIMGENPAMSDPNLEHTRAALASLDHLVVQDIFFTETASFADVILPAAAFAEKNGSFTNTDRRVQMGRQAIEAPGEARQDWWIIQQIAKRLGLAWDYAGVEDIFAEMRDAMPSIAGLDWQRLDAQHSLTYPLTQAGASGTAVLFTEDFPTDSGRARFVSAEYAHSDELPDDEFPLVLTTGRQLEHWHTGSMTRRARVLNELEPEPLVYLNSNDLQRLGLDNGCRVKLLSRRGQLQANVRCDDGVYPGSVFMAFCYQEAAVNLLTSDKLDPVSKIPGYKYNAVKLERIDQETSG